MDPRFCQEKNSDLFLLDKHILKVLTINYKMFLRLSKTLLLI